MNEYYVYLIVGMLLGFVGQKYKDMDTKKYLIFISIVYISVYLFFCVIDETSFIPEIDVALLLLSAIALCALGFHFTKKLEKSKRNKV